MSRLDQQNPPSEAPDAEWRPMEPGEARPSRQSLTPAPAPVAGEAKTPWFMSKIAARLICWPIIAATGWVAIVANVNKEPITPGVFYCEVGLILAVVTSIGWETWIESKRGEFKRERKSS
jgi:hypothetical protein